MWVKIFPGGSDNKSVCLQCGRPWFDPWVGKIPWRRKWQSTLVFLPRKFHGWQSLVGYSPRGCKESDTFEWLSLSSCEVIQLCLTLCNHMDCSLSGSFCPWNFPVKNTRVDCHFLLQEIFPTQESNSCLPHCRQTLHHLSHQEIPYMYVCIHKSYKYA